ncbi:Methyltransf-25 domain-containing protein [Mycena chlorophos]|uniref:Large ribosomal subunit protein bL21m n=1 Tax=Mycena chlorophos TaxID=658473 RepID=A0A8H6WHE7_MYCCL|nr:Methyltransf-25 domain-containing protein [Mycena chlorophos]
MLRRPSSLRCSLHRGFHAGTASPSSPSAALELIRSQPSRYIIATLGGKRHILTPRDLLTVPRIREVKVGDLVALSAIHELGSREYTLRGDPVIPPETGVRVHATVVEHTKGSMEYTFKKKRRKGYQKLIQHKQPYTRLRIGDIEFGSEVVSSNSQA